MQPMDFDEYQEAARRTFPRLDVARDRLTLCWLGMAGETGELVDLYKKHLFQAPVPKEKFEKEVGDVCWYIANYCTEAKFHLDDDGDMDDMTFDDGDMDIEFGSLPTTEMALILSSLAGDTSFSRAKFTRFLVAFSERLELRPFGEILAMNIEKLKARYPEGFTPEDSVSRRDEAAR